MYIVRGQRAGDQRVVRQIWTHQISDVDFVGFLHTYINIRIFARPPQVFTHDEYTAERRRVQRAVQSSRCP